MTQVSDKILAGRRSSTAPLMLGYVQLPVEAGPYALPVLPCRIVLSVAILTQAALALLPLCCQQPLPMRS
jgi:hypothetical protein